ncbi:unnamed protein product [Cuscuta campestris]|uniref:RNA-dependent RNA polymerase n=1 Tax=Cuscuta campestris TaxID=132261 RepID=A0A484NFH4_9ASTE|nr:unnamed protein product [Cuscuta campestris]
MEERITSTVRVANIPQTAIASELLAFLESAVGQDSVFAVEIFTEHMNWKSRGHGRVQFESLQAKQLALSLSDQRRLAFKGSRLSVTHSHNDIIFRPAKPDHRFRNGTLYAGFMVQRETLWFMESWESVMTWINPERRTIEFFLNSHGGECYRLEVQFGDIVETCRCSLRGESRNAFLLKIKFAPKIYRKVYGNHIVSKFSTDRYHICKEDYDFLWVRATDFSDVKSIGYSSSLCWEFEGVSVSDIFSSIPYYNRDVLDILLEKVEFPSTTSALVPLVKPPSDCTLAYEILFQLNSLVHMQKISLAAVDNELFEFLSGLHFDTALAELKSMHTLQSVCYEPKAKIYCLGPELETSNYIVKNYASYASDFLRVTFVEEDWGKLSPGAVSTSISQGIFAKPYRTEIHGRILSVLRDGVTIGAKHFVFLAFSASQLRSNSVWMFASNEHVKAEDIREWMGCFTKIRSVSKCAARMGQLFSTSTQTVEVQPQHVEVIPDIEVTCDGVEYCFSDGIGKISHTFAKQVALSCGLDHIPSAFQIRYGGYKGVIAVDKTSFHKLSLRRSMLKFDSKNMMLNITKWSDAMSCYLNREIVVLLSTLGIADEVFEEMQEGHLLRLGRMLTNRQAALEVLDGMGGGEIKRVLVKMLLQGYEPSVEPYLSTMLLSHYENQLSDLKTRCRISVPMGRIVVGCLDETGILNYGQVYARLTLTKTELRLGEQSFFHRVDDTTAIVKGRVVVTKNPCLHPGDVRVLEAVYEVVLEEKGLVDCIVFPQKGDRPHPNECSGGDLDGDIYFISWDKNLIPNRTEEPMDYTGRSQRIMDHDVTMEEIQRFFVDYMINDTLGAISTAHLVHADREPQKALSSKCLELAKLHSMAVDFAKTGAPAEMPRHLKPREFPDFLERWEKPMYVSDNVLGKLYRAVKKSTGHPRATGNRNAYDEDLIVDGHESFLATAEAHKQMYLGKMGSLMNYYEAESEVEILTGNIRNKSTYLLRDNRRFFELRDRIVGSAKSLHREAKGWFHGSCQSSECVKKLASAWYFVTYHPKYWDTSANCLGFPWIVGDVLLEIKSLRR